MTNDPEFAADLTGFTGTAPLFPLPDVVLFPHVALPLHIFESRYREMVADALDGHKLIAVALLKPGFEADYEGRPPIHEMVCLGRITADERLESGKFNIVLTGIHRAVVTDELDNAASYRTAKLELYRDFYAREPVVDRQTRQRDLLTAFRLLFPRTRTDSLLNQVLEADLPLGVLSDLLGAVLKTSAVEKQSLLEELDVDLRSELLLKTIRQLLASRGAPPTRPVFPPRFSLN
ncbi:MAG: ATP-dependent protease [Planctomycetaceae bacterium]|nr:ATP-dependent protease [Planctomycetaceae bacterium]